MICPPCAQAADDAARIGHPADICRDAAIQPAGCACQHRPVTGLPPREPQQPQEAPK